jgi:hypothetical protein
MKLRIILDLFNGPYKILMWFIIVIIIIYIPIWIIYLHKRSHKVEAFLDKYPHASKVELVRNEVSGILTVHLVDGKKAIIGSEKTKYYLYLLPGIHNLEVSYQWSEIDSFDKVYGVNKVMEGKSSLIKVRVDVGRSYKLIYDQDNKSYILQEDNLYDGI